jgi:hypothetical protein
MSKITIRPQAGIVSSVSDTSEHDCKFLARGPRSTGAYGPASQHGENVEAMIVRTSINTQLEMREVHTGLHLKKLWEIAPRE